MLDFIRVAACVPTVTVGNTLRNTEAILGMARKAAEKQPQLTVFPELSLTGYTCADLFFQSALLQGAKDGLREIVRASAALSSALAVGLPLELGERLYNCAAIVAGGRLLGLVPKTYIPNYNEFYEKRWFTPGAELALSEVSAEALGLGDLQGEAVPIGTDLIFDAGAFRFGAEICEDLWATVPPSAYLAMGGAEVMLNLSASNETISKRRYRRSLVSAQSAAQLDGYVYVSAGCTESTTDLIFSGHSMICEAGRMIAENRETIDGDYILFGDIDLGKMRVDRLKIKTFADGAAQNARSFRRVAVPLEIPENDLSYYPVSRLPFVPDAKIDRTERCMDIFEMQVMGLKKRMEVTHGRPVIGVSGGLDSTLALLVATEAARRMGKPTTDVVGITMPCFGTTDRTYRNSLELMRTLGITALEIPIAAAVEQHFRDIGQDRNTLDLTFENAQARERTQVLMDYAGRIGGFVAGTGDLSELALGWCTYNADHMSMYGVNCGVPKTLVRWMIDSILQSDRFASSDAVLRDILDTPISPELLPPDAEGKIAQQTEEIVGPYALHDFFLYYTVRFGFLPEKVFALAVKAFCNDFDRATIKKWLLVFYRRFFTQQFKRSCLPDGVKLGSICLSPRGDWRMPSDASAELWLARTERIEL